ncbi:MAG: methyltransferase [Rickettsiales bacterium]|jgi:tRNA G10  N-methylase Trm11|nr:methyltransferase [Rickettsiales bacterium]
MNLYYSTFITGFDAAIAEWLAADLPRAKIVRVLDGAILFEAAADPTGIKYFNNSFLVLGKIDGKMQPEKMAELAAARVGKIKTQSKTFKLITMRENQPASLGGKIASRLVDAIEKSTGAKFESRSTDGEFWILTRTEGVALFMMRLTKNDYRPARGEIRPELAHILCRLSSPTPGDVVADPFCGSGAIVLDRSRIADYRGIFAGDISEDAIAALKKKAAKIKQSKFNKSVFIKQRDFFNNGFDNAFFDCIITDPPWGDFSEIASDFYERFFAEAARVLKPDGRMVLLCPRRVDFGAFRAEKSFGILVNGKKAAAYLLRK